MVEVRWSAAILERTGWKYSGLVLFEHHAPMLLKLTTYTWTGPRTRQHPRGAAVP